MKPKLIQQLFALIIAAFFSATVFTQTTTPVDDYILNFMKDKKLPGVGIAIVKDNKLAFAKGYGYADIDKDIPYTPNTIQEIASISKPVTATAAMQLWEQGLFHLDDPIDSYLPFTVRNPNSPGVPVTFRMLMNHTSSIIQAVPVQPLGATMPLGIFLQNFLVPGGSLYNASNYMNFAPGTGYQYSNIAYGLLGYLVERISGMPFNEYCNQNIFQPLCMNNTRWFYSELDTNIVARPYRDNSANGRIALYEMPDYPGGGLKTTLVDLSRFMLMHGNYGILDGVRIIDSETELMMRHQESILSNDPTFAIRYEGLGWQLAHDYQINKDFFGKGGDHPGVMTVANFNITDKTAEMVFTNARTDEGIVPIFFLLDQVVKDTVSTANKPLLNCSYRSYACEQNSDYWKNHQLQWAINSVPMKLGLVHYYKVNDILDLLSRPANGDASIVLAKALIPAKFNIAQGSELEPIILTINSAMNLIGKHRVPYDVPVSFSSATGIQMLNLAATLDSYNSGSLNITGCSGSLTSITRSNAANEIDKTALSYSLSVYPNPSHSSATVSFSLPTPGKVSLTIYDLTGRLVKTIANAELSEGEHTLNFDVNNFRAGIYLLRMESGQIFQTRKFIVQH
jgi:CubicO group peptidase (beta-lactamase class C family)